jgi:CheY-like chemotaxis protein
MKVLLVEDDYLDAMNVQRVFSKLNLHHELQTVRNGKEALDLLQGKMADEQWNDPDLVLLDLNMPKMNGLEFLKEIRADDDLKRLKVFIMTTSDEESDRSEAEKMGIAGYIIKPLTFDRFDNPNSSMDSFNLLCDLLKE